MPGQSLANVQPPPAATMTTPSPFAALQLLRERIARALLSMSRRSALLHLAASLAAGLLSWVKLMPLPPGQPLRLRDIALALVILVGGLFLVAASLNTLQPVFVQLGRLPGWALAAVLAVIVLAWRTWLGHRLLRKLEPAGLAGAAA
jgi:hypothetical protein